MLIVSVQKPIKSRCIFGLALLSFVVTPLSVYGQKTPRKEKEKAAKRACIAGETQVGISLLADLYADSDEPTYIFNQGRCYQQNNLYEQALGRFREYLRKTPNISAEYKAETDRHINECEFLIAKSKLLVSETAKAETPRPESPTIFPNAQSQLPGQGLRTAGVMTVSSGFIFLGTAIGLNWSANEQTKKNQNPYSRDKQETINTYKTLSLVGYGVGVTSLVTGSILYFWGWQTEKTKVSLIPVIVTNRASLWLRGAF